MSDASGEFCGWWKARGTSKCKGFLWSCICVAVGCAGGGLLGVEQATPGERGGWSWSTGSVPSPVAATRGGSMETALVVEKQ